MRKSIIHIYWDIQETNSQISIQPNPPRKVFSGEKGMSSYIGMEMSHSSPVFRFHRWNKCSQLRGAFLTKHRSRMDSTVVSWNWMDGLDWVSLLSATMLRATEIYVLSLGLQIYWLCNVYFTRHILYHPENLRCRSSPEHIDSVHFLSREEIHEVST